MPNHVTNLLTISGDAQQIQALMESIKSDEHGIGTIDFEKITPMPASLKIEAGSRTDSGLKAYRDFVTVYTLDGTIAQDLLHVPPEREDAFLQMRTDIPHDEWELGRTAFRNELLYHAPTWYEWSHRYWGTKWNAYGFPEDPLSFGENCIRFQTAWSAPHPVIRVLAERYPDLEFTHEWADEDIGYNCGRHTYKGGQVVEEYFPEGRIESVNFAARVMDASPEDWCLFLNASGTNYIYLDAEKLECVELLEQPALFTNGRLTADDIPRGLYVYHLRHSDGGERIASIEPQVSVNHAGSVVTKKPISFGEKGYVEFDDESSPNFTGEEMSMYTFLHTDFLQCENESQTPGGMRLCM